MNTFADTGWNLPSQFPDWARFFFCLGGKIHNEHINAKKVCGCIISPTMEFASAFVVAGYVFAEERRRIDPSVLQFDPKEHFRKICQLNLGEPVRFWYHDESFLGRFDGVATIDGEKIAKICIDEIYRDDISEKHAHYITFLSDAERKRYGRKRAGTPFQDDYASLAAIDIEPAVIKSLLEGGELSAALVGSKAKLKAEIDTDLREILKISSSSSLNLGTLISHMETDKAQQVARTLLLSSRLGKKPPKKMPPAIFIDGGAAYFSVQDLTETTPWIVITHFFDPRLDDVVSEVNQRFVSRTASSSVADNIAVPRGTEVMFFEEA